MKNASQWEYNIINEYKDFLENKGTCVIDNFVGMYGQELKIIRETIIDMCQEYYKELISIGIWNMVFLLDV